MYTTAPAETLTADELWAGFGALRLLDDATAQLYEVSGEVSRLVDDAAWRNSAPSVRSLQRHLGELARAVGQEVAAVQAQQAVVRGGMAL